MSCGYDDGSISGSSAYPEETGDSYLRTLRWIRAQRVTRSEPA
jgi:hypothetical protein